MHNKIKLYKKNNSLDGKFRLPYSKSESNRALIIKALNDQNITIHNISDADDTLHLNKCLRLIDNCGVSGLPMVVDVKNAGTVMRFLTAYLAIRQGKWLLTGSPRMQERPILPLVNALKQLGADIQFTDKPGFPPILITGSEIKGGSIRMDTSISSQYITALLLIAPTLERGLKLQLKGDFISRPYVMMTVLMLREFGVDVKYTDDEIFVPYQEKISKNKFDISPDWSAASYAYELVALCESGSLFLPEIKQQSLQGDNVLPEIYSNLGVDSEFTNEGLKLIKTENKSNFLEYDFVNCPDLAQTVLATCVGLGLEGKFKGLQSLRIKETDRIKKMDLEFAAFGFSLKEVKGEWLLKKIFEVDYTKIDHLFQTYGDHRIAMSMAPLVLKTGCLQIENPDVVIKSFPAFWSELENLGFNIKKS